MNQLTTTYKVRQCSKCPMDTEYYCESCSCNLCSKCKENHAKNLKTIDHNVVSHRDKFNYIPTGNVYKKYCAPCHVDLCECSSQSHIQSKHRILEIQGACKTKQQQHRETINTIRSEALFYRPVLLLGITDDIKTCQTQLSLCQSEMLTKAHTLKSITNKVKKDFMNNVCFDFNFKHRCLKQKIKMNIHIVSLQRYVHRYEQSTFRPLQFLLSIKTSRLPRIHLTLHTSQLSMTESLNKEDVMESLSAIQITERGNRCIGSQCLLKLMPGAEFHQSFTVTGIRRCFHISCVTIDQVLVSNRNNLILTNTTGVPLHHVEDIYNDLGSHTVNNESELIYIDRKYNINKLSKNMETTTAFIERTDSTWEPQCVYWSPFTGDLLVGMYNFVTRTGKVTQYNQSGQLTQTIQHDDTRLELYRQPHYITENNNGDVVVSDLRAVVVTERGGKHHFSYTGYPSGSELHPRGICTDALSHILVCDEWTDSVQMLDKDGQFLSHLLMRPSGIFTPWSLSYNVKTHRLWVGSRWNNKVCVYRYITR